jgi:hypothetical protein
MAGMPTPQEEITPIRFVDVCPECGYSLAGSPEEGRCPECGAAYDQSVFILHGAAMGDRAKLINVRAKILAIILSVWAIVWLLVAGMLRDMPRLTVFLWFGTPLILLITLIKRWSHGRPGHITIFLSPLGCLQIDQYYCGILGFAEPIATIIIFVSAGLADLIGQIHARIAPSAIIVAVLLTAALATRWRRQRHLQQSGLVPTTPLEAIEAIGCPWHCVEHIELRKLRGRICMRINRRELNAGSAVNAELHCDSGRAHYLEEMLKRWAPARLKWKFKAAVNKPSQPANRS